MKLRDFTTAQLKVLGAKINRNPEHLRKIARGERPCPAHLALLIEKETNGLLKKEDLAWPNPVHE